MLLYFGRFGNSSRSPKLTRPGDLRGNLTGKKTNKYYLAIKVDKCCSCLMRVILNSLASKVAVYTRLCKLKVLIW